ncbi:MAG: hypothetical protein JJ900_14930 [Rhodospirillales bacterium]|nr:hypothetical protein [Rhodospirillales bacterium]MBO6788140.1 hypothetical protein [Rhodospirillales bacterium]
MKYFVLWGALIVLLSGCQTSSDFYGAGPITLSDSVVRKYEDSYLKKPGSMMFYVTADGRQSGYWYCTAGPDLCRASHDMKFTLDSCKRKTGQSCYVFDEGGWVVWKGPVTWGSRGASRTKPPPPEDLSDHEICTAALPKGSEGERWSSKSETVPFVVEATSRNFSPAECYKIILKKYQ